MPPSLARAIFVVLCAVSLQMLENLGLQLPFPENGCAAHRSSSQLHSSKQGPYCPLGDISEGHNSGLGGCCWCPGSRDQRCC